MGRLSRWAVTAFGLIVILSSAVLALAVRGWTPPPREVVDPFATAAGFSDEELARGWPRFRGPGGAGAAPAANAPTDWDGPSGKGILWKTPLPLSGDSSPLVWDGKVFVTAADKTAREVCCFDADTGKMLWRKRVENVPGSSPLAQDEPEAGFAASTPCTDGRRVFAIFPNMDLIAVDPLFNLYDREWPIRAHVEQYPPAKTVFMEEHRGGRRGLVFDSLVSHGCIVSGGRVVRSILSPGVRVEDHAQVEECVLLDDVRVGKGARLRRTIVDKRVTIPDGMSIGWHHEQDANRFLVTPEMVTVVPKEMPL
jgi:hypothetical protein